MRRIFGSERNLILSCAAFVPPSPPPRILPRPPLCVSKSPGPCAVPAAMTVPWHSACSDVLLYSRTTCEGSGRCFAGASNELRPPPVVDTVGEASWGAADVASGAATVACAEHLVGASYMAPASGFWTFRSGTTASVALVQNTWTQGLTVAEAAGALALGWSQALWGQGSTALPPMLCSAAHDDRPTAALEGRSALLGFGRSSGGQVGLAPGGGGNGAEVSAGDVSRWGVALDSGVAQVSAGGYHSAAVALDGTLVMFGDNQFGQLGRSCMCTGENGRGPHGAAVTELGNGVLCGGAIEAGCGRYHTVVLCQDGSVYTFGRGVEGQLGGSSFVFERTVPGAVTAVGEDNVAVVAGGYHTIIAKASGGLVSFGRNTHGQLCTGSSEASVTTPEAVDFTAVFRLNAAAEQTPVVGVYASPGMLAAGTYHTLMQLHLPGASSSGGEGVAIYGCGRNREGQLGLGDKIVIGRYEQVNTVPDFDDRYVPSPIPTFDAADDEADAVVQLAAGGYHSLVLMESGTVWSFGSNDAGQLGIGLTTFNQPRLQADADYLEYTIDGLAGALKFAEPVRLCADCGIVAIAAGGQTSLVVKSLTATTVAPGSASPIAEALGLAADNAQLCPGDDSATSTADLAVIADREWQALATRSTGCGVNDGSVVMGFGRNDDAQLGGAGGRSALATDGSLAVRIGSPTALGMGCLDGRDGGSWKVTGGITDGGVAGVSVGSVGSIAVGWHHTLVVTGLQCRGGTADAGVVPNGCPTHGCAACAAGRWATRSSGFAAAADCRACGPGTTSVPGDAYVMMLADTDRDGLLSESEFATAQRPADELARIHSDACISCPPGSASLAHVGTWADSNHSQCTQCVAGQYAVRGSARCAQCPFGRHSAVVGATALGICIACPAGTYSAVFGSASESLCIPCAAGSFPTGETPPAFSIPVPVVSFL